MSVLTENVDAPAELPLQAATQCARLPWARLLAFAAIGTIACIAVIVPPNLRTHAGVVAMIVPAAQGPSVDVIRADFPTVSLPKGVGADGQQYYVIARDGWHFHAAARAIDRPRYRDQRILMPALGWLLHPSGGGRGLIVALVLVNIAGLFAGAVAMGALSTTFGGTAALAVLFPLLPGSLESLNLTTPDALAVALALAAIALDLRGHPRRAIAAGVAAVLAKESILLMLIGYAIWRGLRRGWALATIPATAAVAWWMVLRVLLPHTPDNSLEFQPVRGFLLAVQAWSHGGQVVSAACVAAAIVLGLLALRRGAMSTPFGIAIALQLGFVLCLAANVLYHELNGTRATLPLFALAALAIVATRGTRGAGAVTEPIANNTKNADIVRQPLPWRKLIVLAAIGTVLCVAQVLPQNLRTVQGFARMIEPGSSAAATPLIHRDFPDLQLVRGVGHDGQSFYALARSPMHLHEISQYLDRPQYRAQRILFPLLAWMLHPTGGGMGLIAALVAVGIAALFIGGVSLGALSASLGGRVEVAVFFALLPGAAASLNLSVADALAIALALATIALDIRRHPQAAIAAGIGAALTKESLILVLIGYALWRRDRQGLRLATIPAAVAGAWWCILHFTLPSSGKQVVEFDPGHGLFVSVRYWLHGNQVDGGVVFGLALCAAILALRRGAWRTPLGYAIVLQLAFVFTLAGNVIAVPDNGSRATLPLLALSIAALTAPLPASSDDAPEPDAISSPHAILASAR